MKSALATATLALLGVSGCAGGADDTPAASAPPSATPSPSATATPTGQVLEPNTGTLLTGSGLTNAERSPAATPPPTPTSALSTPTESIWQPAFWEAEVTIQIGGLPSEEICQARYSEAGVPSEAPCESCDFTFAITRSIIQSEGICEWPSNDTFELAFFLDEGRVDRLIPPETDEGEATWTPWYTLSAVEIIEDPGGQWAGLVRYTFYGHPDAGFQAPLN